MYSLKDAYDKISGIIASAGDLAGIKGYEHDQSTPSDTWTVAHGLGTYNVDVLVTNTSEEVIVPAGLTLDSADQITITFPTGTLVDGKARIMAKT